MKRQSTLRTAGSKDGGAEYALREAVQLHQQGQLAEAARRYRRVLDAHPAHFDAMHLLGAVRSQQGRHAEARDLIQHALQLNPRSSTAWFNLGLVQAALGAPADALISYDRALAINPANAQAHNNRGNVLADLKRPDEAIASYEKALAVRSDYAEAHNNRGNALKSLGRLDEALASFDMALGLRPGYAEALNNRGSVLRMLERFEEAIAALEQALSARPGYAEALNNLGIALKDIKRPGEAITSFDQALAIRPAYPEAYNNRGNALLDLDRTEEALASYDRALGLRPDYAEAHHNRGLALKKLERADEALASYASALDIKPDYAEAHYNRGTALKDKKRLGEAIDCFDKALALEPDHKHAFAALADALATACDWDRIDAVTYEVRAHIAERRSVISPFAAMGYVGDPALLRQCSEAAVLDRFGAKPPLPWKGQPQRNGKINVAYLSFDYRTHPAAFLTAELFELHDRDRFRVHGISFGPDDRSPIRARLADAFDEFHDVRARSDAEVARLLVERNIDIAVDLAGYTFGCRPGILALRPAPIQANFLGFPGTMAAPFIDYIIADEFVVPPEHEQHYTEKVAYLSDCYMPNDRRRAIADKTPTRADVGLPERGFVFCSFNNTWKIKPDVFDIWMRLLKAVDGSVMWLLRPNAAVETNLRREAQKRGVDPARLVFARHMKLEHHLARHRLADLFLDTLPYNAHTTASDALWAGLPIVTCVGGSFAGRVAASLLKAIELPELVTSSLADYEALALALATNPARLEAIRRKLARNRDTTALFNTDRYCRSMEAAFTEMRDIHLSGEPPRRIRVKLPD